MRKTILNLKNLGPIAYRVLRWHLSFYLKKQGFPLSCSIYLTNSCNLKCRMCSMWMDQKKGTLSMEQVRGIIDSLYRDLCYLSFCGGEPLLVTGLFDMIRYASEKVPHTHLVTNGLLLDKSAAEDFAQSGLSEISVSLDGEESWHNDLRKSNQSFRGAVKAIENLRANAPDVTVVVNSVLFPDRPDQIWECLRMTKDLGVKIKIQAVNPHFSFDNQILSLPKFELSAMDRPEIDKLIKELLGNPNVVNSRTYLRSIPRYFSNDLNCPMIKRRCILPYYFLEAGVYNKASPCMLGTDWEGIIELGEGIVQQLKSRSFRGKQKELESCKRCNQSLFICYWEPMLNFPLFNFLRYGLTGL